MVYNSVRVFMNEIIDYAGIFPPAGLTLKESFDNFNDYRFYKHNWMLSKFVCPFSKLPELAELITQKSGEDKSGKLKIAVLGSISKDEAAFEKNIGKDINDIHRFLKKNESKVVIESFEVRLPPDLTTFRQSGDFIDILNNVREKASEHISRSMQIFLETEYTSKDWRDTIDSLSSTLSVCNNYYSDEKDYMNLGFKFRTGGITLESYPTIEQAAYAIGKCLDNKVPFKATAGLHHPVRHFSEQAKTKMHGFLNIFGAGILYFCKKIEPNELIKVIEDENPENFKFDEDSFSWRNRKVTVPEIEEARKFMLSFGSCSFDEPRHDLRNMKVLQ